jgi:hypothetical protein
MAWFERELEWGVSATELRHLCGRIGELYAALIANGQMALHVNQKGYDVVSGSGERISVKTTAIVGAGHVNFNSNTLNEVDRVIVLRINTDEMQVETLLNATVSDAILLMTGDTAGKRTLSLSRIAKPSKPRREIATAREVRHLGYVIRELETGAIEVERDGQPIAPVKPALREMATTLGVSLVNINGNTMNTRQLGSRVVDSILALQSAGRPRIDIEE